MKPWMWMSAGVGLMMAAGVAVAQVPPAATPGPGTPPPPPAGQMDGAPGRDGHHPMDHGPMDHGPMGMRARWMMHHMMDTHRPPPSKAAHFRFRKGDAMVDIKCADDESTKACVDAGSALLDKLAAQPK